MLPENGLNVKAPMRLYLVTPQVAVRQSCFYLGDDEDPSIWGGGVISGFLFPILGRNFRGLCQVPDPIDKYGSGKAKIATVPDG
jgi:hypothetical protein